MCLKVLTGGGGQRGLCKNQFYQNLSLVIFVRYAKKFELFDMVNAELVIRISIIVTKNIIFKLFEQQ